MDPRSEDPILGDRFDDALAYASRAHRPQARKGSGIPYVSHLLGVCAIALENGADEDQAIAALLHDAVEDQGGMDRLADIRGRYGARVAEIVLHCTDSHTVPKPPWRERKEAYLAGLAGKPRPSLEASVADKTHNVASIVHDMRIVGDTIWDRFTGKRNGTLWYYRSLADRFLELIPGPGAERFARLVGELEELAEAR